MQTIIPNTFQKSLRILALGIVCFACLGMLIGMMKHWIFAESKKTWKSHH